MIRHGDKLETPRRGKIPIPVSVSLRNLCRTSTLEAQAQSKGKKWFRPEHAMSLLHQVRLEIVIVPPDNKHDEGNDVAGNTTASSQEKIILSSLADVKTVNPTWHHLDEYIEDYLALDGYLDSETSAYRCMRLRIWLVPQELNNDNKGEAKRQREDVSPLLDIGIHPKKLHHLAKIPQQLPINSVIFHFSDGSIRATRTLLDIVGDQDGSHADEHNKDEFGRFGDDVFRTLDQVTPVKNAKNTSREGKIADRVFVAQSSDDSLDAGGSTPLSKAGTKLDTQQQQALLLASQTTFSGGEMDAVTQDLAAERSQLEGLIQMEEDALQQEMFALREEKSATLSLMEKASKIEANITKLEESIMAERLLCRQSEFYLDARRIKLLHDLRNIYPVSFLVGEDRFCCIRDLRIPTDIHSGVVGEEELSAALGFLCHLVSMMSKYMGVQLRHRLFCNSSRSAVQEDGGPIFPLFQARAVERDQLDRGVLLLQRNVECILKTRELEYNRKEHILVNVNRLFGSVVDGVE